MNYKEAEDSNNSESVPAEFVSGGSSVEAQMKAFGDLLERARVVAGMRSEDPVWLQIKSRAEGAWLEPGSEVSNLAEQFDSAQNDEERTQKLEEFMNELRMSPAGTTESQSTPASIEQTQESNTARIDREISKLTSLFVERYDAGGSDAKRAAEVFNALNHEINDEEELYIGQPGKSISRVLDMLFAQRFGSRLSENGLTGHNDRSDSKLNHFFDVLRDALTNDSAGSIAALHAAIRAFDTLERQQPNAPGRVEIKEAA